MDVKAGNESTVASRVSLTHNISQLGFESPRWYVLTAITITYWRLPWFKEICTI